jgi:hypothetical protein
VIPVGRELLIRGSLLDFDRLNSFEGISDFDVRMIGETLKMRRKRLVRTVRISKSTFAYRLVLQYRLVFGARESELLYNLLDMMVRGLILHR